MSIHRYHHQYVLWNQCLASIASLFRYWPRSTSWQLMSRVIQNWCPTPCVTVIVKNNARMTQARTRETELWGTIGEDKPTLLFIKVFSFHCCSLLNFTLFNHCLHKKRKCLGMSTNRPLKTPNQPNTVTDLQSTDYDGLETFIITVTSLPKTIKWSNFTQDNELYTNITNCLPR